MRNPRSTRTTAIVVAVALAAATATVVLWWVVGCGPAPPAPPAPVATSLPTETPAPPSATPLPTETPVLPTETPPDESHGDVLLIFGSRFISSIYKSILARLEAAGYTVVVASRGLGSLQAKDSDLRVKPDLLLKEVRVQDYAAIIFTCDNDVALGNGRPETDRIAQEAVKQGKVLAAICNAPRLLGYAGVLQGRKATGEHSSTCKLLETKFGAKCTGAAVQQDGLIITGKDRWAVGPFVDAILKTLREQ
jgi:protease I